MPRRPKPPTWILRDPDKVGQSEYRAIYDNLVEIVAIAFESDLPDGTVVDFDATDATLKEFAGWAQAMREDMWLNLRGTLPPTE